MQGSHYRKSFLAIVAITIISLASCARKTAPAPGVGQKRVVIVSAAASAKDLIEELAKEFGRTSPTEVKVNAGPSNALASQILAGAPADLFLSANQQWADEIEKASHAIDKVRLLTNGLVIVVPKGNPGEVHEPTDLLSEKVKKVALAGEKVPAGMYAEQALTKLDLFRPLMQDQKIVRGQDVRNALSFVERGEAEAGIVYSTDVRISPNVVTAHEFDASLHGEIVYVLVLLENVDNRSAARKFYEFLQSPDTNKVYEQFGFTRLH
jgi:molybdate transport system substrate-binding protein